MKLTCCQLRNFASDWILYMWAYYPIYSLMSTHGRTNFFTEGFWILVFFLVFCGTLHLSLILKKNKYRSYTDQTTEWTNYGKCGASRTPFHSFSWRVALKDYCMYTLVVVTELHERDIHSCRNATKPIWLKKFSCGSSKTKRT